MSLEKKRDVVLSSGGKTLEFIQGLCAQEVAVYANREKEKIIGSVIVVIFLTIRR